MKEICKQKCLELCRELNERAIEEVKKSDTSINTELISLALRCNEFALGLSSQMYFDADKKETLQ